MNKSLLVSNSLLFSFFLLSQITIHYISQCCLIHINSIACYYFILLPRHSLPHKMAIRFFMSDYFSLKDSFLILSFVFPLPPLTLYPSFSLLLPSFSHFTHSLHIFFILPFISFFSFLSSHPSPPLNFFLFRPFYLFPSFPSSSLSLPLSLQLFLASPSPPSRHLSRLPAGASHFPWYLASTYHAVSANYTPESSPLGREVCRWHPLVGAHVSCSGRRGNHTKGRGGSGGVCGKSSSP